MIKPTSKTYATIDVNLRFRPGFSYTEIVVAGASRRRGSRAARRANRKAWRVTHDAAWDIWAANDYMPPATAPWTPTEADSTIHGYVWLALTAAFATLAFLMYF